jgi:hypothetical protein
MRWSPRRPHDAQETHATSSMSVPAFFDYLHDHDATTDLAKALGEVVMLRTCGARRDVRTPSSERLAS